MNICFAGKNLFFKLAIFKSIRECIDEYFSIEDKNRIACPICKKAIKSTSVKSDKKFKAISEILRLNEKYKESFVLKEKENCGKIEFPIKGKIKKSGNQFIEKYVIFTTRVPSHIDQELQKFKILFHSHYTIKIGKSCLSSSTHLLVMPDQNNKCTRTLKYLKALVKGIWILSYSCTNLSYKGLIDCIMAHQILSEEQYEISGDSIGDEIPIKSRLGVIHIIK